MRSSLPTSHFARSFCTASAVLRRSCKCSKAALNHAHQRIRELETTSAAMAERTAFATERATMLEMQLIEIHCGPRVAATERRGQLVGLQESAIRTATTYCPFRLWNL